MLLIKKKEVIFISIFFNVVFLAHSRDLPPSAERGESIFLQKCSSCHTIGQGKLVGPDLKGVTDRRSESWLKGFIKDPQEFFSKKDEIATALLKEYNIPMPPSGLSEIEINQIISFLKYQSGTVEQVEKKMTPGEVQGNPDTGRDLFIGAKRFKNGGPACISCHSIAGLDLPGGSLAPDLTRTISNYGKDGLLSVLSDIPFPTMKPIYQNKITEEESQHLVTFLESVNPDSLPVQFRRSAYIIASGVILFLALMQVVWGSRLKNVRRNLVDRTKFKGGV